MPVVQAVAIAGTALQGCTEEETLRQELLLKIASEAEQQRLKNMSKALDHDSDDEAASLSALEQEAEQLRRESLAVYQKLAAQTQDIRLDKLIKIPDGCLIFDELCLRVDINQRYVSILPQWKDLADILEVDQLRTLWIETCIRPREGLTRAMLEIYMKDGGTLGEVLDALIRLELFEVLETLREKLTSFCKMHLEEGNKISLEETSSLNSLAGDADEKFFSVLATLAKAFQKGDPCQNIQKYSDGLKNFCRDDAVMETVGFVHSSPAAANMGVCQSAPQFRSDVHLKQFKPDQQMVKEEVLKKVTCRSCKILLLFSEDGVVASELAVRLADEVQVGDCRVDLFRLNETTLWYEMLTNPEGCCLKWSAEADYIIPILTPKFLQEIHGGRRDGGDGSENEFIPTSPVLNRYMYTLIRSQYTQAGCKNYRVRPIIPMQYLREVRSSNAVTMDPLFNHVWIPMTQEKVIGRFKGLLQEFAKKQQQQLE